tara:strand:- start:468 stop:959 length:492 start_codon:yes stop_codon:yes gene_type:complete
MTNYNLNAHQNTLTTFVHPWYLAQQQQESSISSDVPLQRKPKRARPGEKLTDKSRLGDLAERWVTTLCAWKGAEVFPNLSCTGKTDFMMVYQDKTYQFDVKCRVWYPSDNCWKSNNAYKVKAPVYPIMVTPEGDISEWKVQWATPERTPPGLENFWKKSSTTV